MSKSEIRGKHDEDATQLYRRSQSGEGHKSEKTGGPRHMHPVDKIRGHVSVSRRRIRMTGCHVGPDDIPSRCTSTWRGLYSS